MRRARRLARTVVAAARRRAPRGVILLYHRVAAPRFDPLMLDVSPTNFAAQLEFLASSGTVLPLETFESLRERGKLPPRATAITFDDGYADNLHVAAPILARHALPATVFVATGMIGSTAEFWWDDVERIACARAFAGKIPLGGVPWTGDDGVAADADGWTIFSESRPNARQRLYLALQAKLKSERTDARVDVMAALRNWAGVGAAGRPSHRTMTADEVRELSRRPGMQIGAHTVNHPSLALLDWDEQCTELAESRAALEKLLGRAPTSAAYPFGTREEVSATTTRAARVAGFDYALANEPGAAWRWSGKFRIPRMLVRDWSADALAQRMSRWWGGDV